LELTTIPPRPPEDVNLMLGRAHFIKTVDYLREALPIDVLAQVRTVPGGITVRPPTTPR
jgi:adenosine/AMP kinase